MRQTIESIKASIPDHLRCYIVDQYETEYTPEDQAVWRYILRQLKNYLTVHAHDSYLEGLEKTGITVNEIPSINEMCMKLQSFGWAAIPVSGFIPPAAFMELQSLGILPIASDMRSIDHISYTPAPDIVHEAAGHAPILVDPKFANYLKSYAQVAKKALLSREDLAQYEAIRELSDLKEHPDSTPEQIQASEEKLESINKSMSFVSEAALLGRMNWWTAEYGLIGNLKSPKIYGAGLLSSIGEAKSCLEDDVEKVPLSVDCVRYTYDITEPQPQLFVAENFDDLPRVLEDLADKLAFRKGGMYGLEKAIQAETVNTVELNSGLQISGVVKEMKICSDQDEASYYRFEGPVQLCTEQKQLPGHGKDYHSHGFSSPLGLLKGWSKCLSEATAAEQEKLGLIENQKVELEFASGIRLEGRMLSKTEHNGKLILLTFTNCQVKLGEEVLFNPAWGDFDMAVGSQVTSVYAGPADRKAYGLIDSFATKKVPVRQQSKEEQQLGEIYKSLRKMRKANEVVGTEIDRLVVELKNFPDQWLPRLEILELIERGWVDKADAAKQLRSELQKLMEKLPEKKDIIADGLVIADKIF